MRFSIFFLFGLVSAVALFSSCEVEATLGGLFSRFNGGGLGYGGDGPSGGICDECTTLKTCLLCGRSL
jgi:hypothetical protein